MILVNTNSYLLNCISCLSLAEIFSILVLKKREILMNVLNSSIQIYFYKISSQVKKTTRMK